MHLETSSVSKSADALEMFDKNPGGERLFAIQLVFLLLGCIFGLLRAYVKIVMIKKVTIDDYLMFVAIVGPAAPG